MTLTESPAVEMSRLHHEITSALRSSLDKAIRIGEILTDTKAGLEHGEWLPWLKVNAPFAERTARNYMRCFAERDLLKSASVADLNEAYKLLAYRPDYWRAVTCECERHLGAVLNAMEA